MTKLGPEKKSGESRNLDNRGPDNRGSTVHVCTWRVKLLVSMKTDLGKGYRSSVGSA